MTLTSSMSGVKRPAAFGPEDDGDGDGDARPTQQPRIEVSTKKASEASEGDNEQQGNINTDLICEIATFIDTGETLTNLCIAVGPEDSGKIRYDYLKNNDKYIVKFLTKLKKLRIGPIDWSIDWARFHDYLPMFDKCKHDMATWMEINDDWKTRCTAASMESFRKLRMDANLIFNNPLVALEIGLLEVFRFLVEDKGIDVNTARWRGIVSTSSVRTCLVRGDPVLLDYLMSCDGLDINMLDGPGNGSDIVRFAAKGHDYIDWPCFELFIRHPKVNLNVRGGYRTPLLCALDRLKVDFRYGSCYENSLARINALLDAGADPHFTNPYDDVPIAYAKRMLRSMNCYYTNSRQQVWKGIIQKMEGIIGSA